MESTTATQPRPSKKQPSVLLISLGLMAFVFSCCIVVVSLSNSIKRINSSNPTNVMNTAIAEIKTALPTPLNTATPPPPPTATLLPSATSTPKPAVSVGVDANLRLGPGMDFPVNQVAKAGSVIEVYFVSSDGQWYSVNPENQLWIHSSVITPITPLDSLPKAPTPTRTRTQTAVPSISIGEVYYNFDHMTALQFKEYMNSIVGKPVNQKVTIGNVNENGDLSLYGEWKDSSISIYEFCVTVNNVPKDVALELDGGDRYELHAYIQGIVGNYNYYYNCENTLVLTYRGQ